MIRCGRRAGVAIGAAALLLGAGCSSGPTPQPSPEPAPASSADPGRISPTDLPTPPVVTDSTGAAKDVTLGDCATGQGKQSVTGTVTSSAKKTVDYVITVSWTNDSSDVRGRGVAVIDDLKPGEKKDFSITAQVAAGATLCTKNVLYGTVKR